MLTTRSEKILEQWEGADGQLSAINKLYFQHIQLDYAARVGLIIRIFFQQ